MGTYTGLIFPNKTIKVNLVACAFITYYFVEFGRKSARSTLVSLLVFLTSGGTADIPPKVGGFKDIETGVGLILDRTIGLVMTYKNPKTMIPATAYNVNVCVLVNDLSTCFAPL
jgi:hypothetical protein